LLSATEQLTRLPRPFPTLKISPDAPLTLDGLDGKDGKGGFKAEHFEVVGYKPLGKIEMKMSV
jgi:thymidylate synthase